MFLTLTREKSFPSCVGREHQGRLNGIDFQHFTAQRVAQRLGGSAVMLKELGLQVGTGGLRQRRIHPLLNNLAEMRLPHSLYDSVVVINVFFRDLLTGQVGGQHGDDTCIN